MIWFVVDKNPIEREWEHMIFEFIHKYCRFFHIHIKNIQHIVFLNKGLDDAISKNCLRLSLKHVFVA